MEKSTIEQMALRHMSKWGLCEEWAFEWGNAKRQIGLCQWHPYKVIRISWYIAKHATMEQIEDTVLHEIAHALDFEQRGTSDHGPKWKAWALKVGAQPIRSYKKIDTPAKYSFICPNHGVIGSRNRKARPNVRYTCRICREELTLKENK